MHPPGAPCWLAFPNSRVGSHQLELLESAADEAHDLAVDKPLMVSKGAVGHRPGASAFVPHLLLTLHSRSQNISFLIERRY